MVMAAIWIMAFLSVMLLFAVNTSGWIEPAGREKSFEGHLSARCFDQTVAVKMFLKP